MTTPAILQMPSSYRRILAVGDIHGQDFLLAELLNHVKPTRDDLIITLGDYIDRGFGSRDVIDRLVALHQDPQVNIVSLRGNHDAMMIMCADGISAAEHYPSMEACDEETIEAWEIASKKKPARLWIGNQAATTISSYLGGAAQSDQLRQVDDILQRKAKGGQKALQKLLAEVVPQEHLNFLRHTCVDACETEDFIFVHGGLCLGLPLTEHPLFPLHWTRFNPKTSQPHVSGKKVVCGHTPQPDLLIHDLGHTVCLDTGAYMAKGTLTCMDVLSGRKWQINDDRRLAELPVVHYEGKVPFVRISDMPEDERERFQSSLVGRNVPFEGCAWPWDFNAWRWGGKLGPRSRHKSSLGSMP